MSLPNPIDSLLASLATPFTQHSRLLTLRLADSAGLDAERLLPQRLTGKEHLSQCYRYELDCLSVDSLIELKDLLGQPVAAGILQADSNARTICGVVTSARHDGSDGGFTRYALVIEPAFATLSLRTNSRVFQDLSVPEIVTAVLQEHIDANPVFAASFRLEMQLQQDYAVRSYCLQYRESDHAFIERLLAEEGISYRFTFDAAVGNVGNVDSENDAALLHTLVLFDDWQSLDANAQDRIRFHRADGTEADDTIIDWQAARQLVAGKSALASFDYRPVSRHEGAADTDISQGEAADKLASTLERYDPQTLYYGTDPEEMTRYARLRQQAADLSAKVYAGEGTVRSLQAGTWFSLENHPVHEQDVAELREFIVLSVELEAFNNILPVDGDAARPYTEVAPFVWTEI